MAVGRAVADLSVFGQVPVALLSGRGVMVAAKGIKTKAEVRVAQQAIGTLGGRVVEVRKVDAPGLEEARYLVVVEKITPTPARYPPRPGIPSKRPLS